MSQPAIFVTTSQCLKINPVVAKKFRPLPKQKKESLPFPPTPALTPPAAAPPKLPMLMDHGSPSLAEFPPLSYATAVSATHSNHRLLSSPSSHYQKPSYSSSPSASYRKPLILTRLGQSPRMLRAAVNASTDTRAQILKTHPGSVGLSPRNTNTSTPPRGGEGRRVQHTGQTVQATSHALPPPRRIVKAVRRGGRGGGGCGSNSMAVSPAKPRHTPCMLKILRGIERKASNITTPLASSASTMYYPSSSSSSGRAKATPTSGIPKPRKRVRGDGNNNAAPSASCYAPNAPKTPTVPKKRMR